MHAFAHVTGGGIAGNLVRVLPDTSDARRRPVDLDAAADLRPDRRAGRVDAGRDGAHASTWASAWSPSSPADGRRPADVLGADARGCGRPGAGEVASPARTPTARRGAPGRPAPTGSRCLGVSRREEDPVVVGVVLVVVVARRRSSGRDGSDSSAGSPVELALQAQSRSVPGVLYFSCAGHLRLLGLGTAAPHGSTPSHRTKGRPARGGPESVGHRRGTTVQLTRPTRTTSRHRRRARAVDAGHPVSGAA